MITPLRLSAYEQDALAELCTHMAGIQHAASNSAHYDESKLAVFLDSSERFDRINWGTLYDKLHRSGANA